MHEYRVSSWLELMDVLHQDTWNESLHRFRSPYVFRGQGRELPLTTTLQRLGGDPSELERHLVRAFRKYAYGSVPDRDLLWYWLAVGQHHGLPTRLLDWSYSPLVALHFATASEDLYGEDGVVWMLNFSETNAGLPVPLRDMLEHEGSAVFTVDMLAALGEASGALPPSRLGFDSDTHWLEQYELVAGQPFLLFLEPPSLDQRIVQQSALFSMLSNPNAQIGDWLHAHDGAVQKIILPAELKGEIRDKLDQANITERTLFPDLGGLSQWLRRYYRVMEPPQDEAAEEQSDGDRSSADHPLTPEEVRMKQH
ncbi:FRG domain-containing protein [Deinococcus sp. Marseille-Q6407]|uniref:FRG domain-containing protein n=1 Tax=Deinococcus sp. Marseille-Q6407 TaxID=2969223 RepID=UPI0021C1A540|nr:FRG domain-containing protein [Deinococcus sp. Marseille-Q6407]